MEFIVATDCNELVMLKKDDIKAIRPVIQNNILSVRIYMKDTDRFSSVYSHIEHTLDADLIKNLTPNQLVDISCELIRQNTVTLDINEHGDQCIPCDGRTVTNETAKLNRDEVCEILSRLPY